MKTILILAAAAIMTFTMTGCSGAAQKSEKDVKNTAEKAQAAEESTTTSSFSIPGREAFTQIPEGAEGAFDKVIDAVDSAFPKEKKSSHRLYGYMGQQEINDVSCYVFAVYDKDGDDVETQVTTAAISVDGQQVFTYDEQTTAFTRLQLPETETDSWASEPTTIVVHK